MTSIRSVEVLTSLGQYLCSLAELPDSRHSHTQTGLVTCGGGESPASCLTFSPASGSWAASHSLPKPGRSAHSSWEHGGEVYLLGGADSGLTSEKLTSAGQSVPAFTLKYETA